MANVDSFNGTVHNDLLVFLNHLIRGRMINEIYVSLFLWHEIFLYRCWVLCYWP